MSVVFLYRDTDENVSFLYGNFSWKGTNPLNPQLFSAGSKEQFGNHQLTPPFFVHQVEKVQKTEIPELLLLIFEHQMHSSAVSPVMSSSVLLLQIEIKCSMASRQSIIYFQEKNQHLTDHNPQNARHFFTTWKNKHCKPGFFFHLYLPMCNVLIFVLTFEKVKSSLLSGVFTSIN